MKNFLTILLMLSSINCIAQSGRKTILINTILKFLAEQNYLVHSAVQGQGAGLSNIVVRGYGDIAELNSRPDIEFEKIKLDYSILVRFELR